MTICIGAQPRREDCAGRAGAYNDDVTALGNRGSN
jgi:hypothetical protein